jgi:hypothetical protein
MYGMLAAIVGAVVFTAAAPSAQGQGYRAPKTPWGDPDLQGIWNGNDLQGVPMQRAESVGTRTTLNDDEYRQRVATRDQQLANDNSDEFTLERAEEFEKRFGTVGGAVSPPPHWLERAVNVSRQASFVIDPPNGRIPPLTPEAQKRQQENQQRVRERQQRLRTDFVREADSYTDRSNYDRCISLGTLGSLTPKIYNSGNRIVQGPGWVAFQNEMIHETRVIPTDGRPNPAGKGGIESWMGTSVGRWEGDTLVVETRGLKPESALQGGQLSDEGRIIERFTRISPDVLEYKMTVDDPKTWTAPWTLMMPLPRDDDYGFYEYACHEGNYTMRNILSGSRAAEKAYNDAVARGEKPPQPEPLPAGGRGGRGGRGGQ